MPISSWGFEMILSEGVNYRKESKCMKVLNVVLNEVLVGAKCPTVQSVWKGECPMGRNFRRSVCRREIF
jgi:hypothetical protein